MLATIIALLETITIAVSGFLIKKYIFLEPDIEQEKQRKFYYLVFFISAGFFAVFVKNTEAAKNWATIIVLLLIALNIFMGRKEHRVRGMALILAIMGIINGLMTPILTVMPFLLSLTEHETQLYQLAAYAILAIGLILFGVFGKKWRLEFEKSMKFRHLFATEKLLLFAVTVFSDAYHLVTLATNNLQATGSYNDSNLLWIVGTGSMSAFFMTITSIALIMQGNKRYIYYEQVSHMQSGMIFYMAEIVEDRDLNTGGHIKRTAKYVESIAKELKKDGLYADTLTDTYMRNMVIAAPLHDIGKIHIRDAVLNKPGRLTNEEFAEMKTHTTAGEKLLTDAKKMLGESEYLNMAIQMAAYHHEWWNGKGYPYGVSDEEIPLCARIMAVADVFDALVSKRVYKDSMPLEKAYSIIREESGTHFDPKITDAFFAITDDIEKLLAEESE